MAVEEIAAQLDGYGCDLVEITGGEPLLQDGVHPLIASLLDAGMTVMIETSGARDVSAARSARHQNHGSEMPGQRRSRRAICGATWSI